MIRIIISVLAGIGYGCTYTPPIQAMIEWFPDKRGIASGIVIAGFGSGALFFTPMMNTLSAKFAQMPEYLGKSIETVTESGKMFTKVGESMQEVVYATASDLAKLPYSDLAEGFYVVGSGNTGLAGAIGTIAAGMYKTVGSLLECNLGFTGNLCYFQPIYSLWGYSTDICIIHEETCTWIHSTRLDTSSNLYWFGDEC